MAIDIEIGAGSISTGGSAPTRSLDERIEIGAGSISTGGSAPTRSMNEQRDILTKALMLSGHAPMIFAHGPILGYLPGLGECLFGLSSHEKPVADTLRIGLLFFEVDTGNTWVWVGYEWIVGPDFPAAVGGGGGGAATIANGADVTQGAVADAAWVSGNGTVISLLKKIASAGGGAVSVADGADVTQGAVADAAVDTDAPGTLSAKLRGLIKLLVARLPAALGGGGGLKIDGSGTALPVSGTVSVTGVATETTLAAASDKLPATLGQKVSTASFAIVTASDDSNLSRLITGTGRKTAGSPLATTAFQMGGTYNATPPTIPDLGEASFQLDASGRLIVVVGSIPSHAVTNAGTFPVQSGAAATGGATPGKLISAATTNATSVKASAGTLYFCTATNNGAAPAYVKWTDKASAPTVGTDVPVLVFEIPANSTAALGAGTNVPLGPVGAKFTAGLALSITGGIADTDTTAVAANQVILNYGFN